MFERRRAGSLHGEVAIGVGLAQQILVSSKETPRPLHAIGAGHAHGNVHADREPVAERDAGRRGRSRFQLPQRDHLRIGVEGVGQVAQSQRQDRLPPCILGDDVARTEQFAVCQRRHFTGQAQTVLGDHDVAQEVGQAVRCRETDAHLGVRPKIGSVEEHAGAASRVDLRRLDGSERGQRGDTHNGRQLGHDLAATEQGKVVGAGRQRRG